ncbi:MAG TPA: hypothetical protein VGL44_15615 [Gaiellales bacterium]
MNAGAAPPDANGWRWASAQVPEPYLSARASFIDALMTLARTLSGWRTTRPAQNAARDALDQAAAALPALVRAHPVLTEQCGQSTGYLLVELGQVAEGWPADDAALPKTFAAHLEACIQAAVQIALPVLLNLRLNACTTGQGIKLAGVIGNEVPNAADRQRMMTVPAGQAKEVSGWFSGDTVYATPTKRGWKIWFGVMPALAVVFGFALFLVLGHLDDWFGSVFGPGSQWPTGLRDNTLMPAAFAVALVGALLHVAVDHQKVLRAADDTVGVVASRQSVAWLWVHSVGLVQRIAFVAAAAVATLALAHHPPLETLALAGYSTDSVIGLIFPKLSAIGKAPIAGAA